MGLVRRWLPFHEFLYFLIFWSGVARGHQFRKGLYPAGIEHHLRCCLSMASWMPTYTASRCATVIQNLPQPPPRDVPWASNTGGILHYGIHRALIVP